ncbi:C-terminal four TMM region of protein-O-mannosyltransferase [Nonomuraea maritima]|uniref:Polyprenol-phosphate-mannose--protein mannosyltransferase n=1 Tax=Nonomuraea maritima TaxID=683260 RepID=A0A1G8UBN8_9ACTN|nr:phospholipid carrier-dependent glycosyltransferase [Nonomuraea maritima]SDJ51161.1 C-terminal four TMM region of protein-O-mannosyltransferase [Nonomuraea maritima]
MPGSPLVGWAASLLVALFGGVLRFVRLGEPRAVVFDETYYMKDAYSLLLHGVERTTLGTVEDPVADQRILAGNLDVFKHCVVPTDCASFVAHPPLGKWMIAAGEWLFGMNPFGWRFAAALVGTLSILVMARVARRMTRSTLLGCLAGLLLSLDGLHLVLSRTALLDIFLMFWVLAGFACLVADRDWARERLTSWYANAPVTPAGPRLGFRPWRLAAGLCLGAACAVKWSGVFFLIAFAVLSLVWDAGARRALGLRQPYRGTRAYDLPGAVGALAVVPAVTYLLSWTGWFATDAGWGRDWERATSSTPAHFVWESMRSWVRYQLDVLGYHSGLDQYHSYMSEPWEWPVLLRPVSFYYPPDLPPSACGADKCSQAVHGVGTPALWYGAALALIALITWYVARRDWRAGAVLLAFGAGWLPWFYYAIADNRTMYLFYMMPVVPFMVLAVTLCAGLVLGGADASPNRRALGAAVVGSFTLVVLVNLGWLLPVLTAETITYAEWWARMLFGSWVTAAPK